MLQDRFEAFCIKIDAFVVYVGSVVEWLKRRANNKYGVDSKLTRAILLYPWKSYITALSPAWWSWQAVLN